MPRAVVVRRGPFAGGLARVDRRLAGVALMAFSLVGGLRLGAAPTPAGVLVLAATHDLPANTPIKAGDLRQVRVRAEEEVLARLVRPPGERLVGHVPLHPVPRHGLIDWKTLTRAPSAGREISVPLEAAHALGGAIRIGERVDVLASFGRGGGSPRTVVVTRSARVVAIGRSEGAMSGMGGEVASVTLAVPAGDALQLAFAMRNAELDFVRSTGSPDPGPEVVDLATLDVGPEPDLEPDLKPADPPTGRRPGAGEGGAGCSPAAPGWACR